VAQEMMVYAWNNHKTFDAAYPAPGLRGDPKKKAEVNRFLDQVLKRELRTQTPHPWLTTAAKEGDRLGPEITAAKEPDEPTIAIHATCRDYDNNQDEEGALAGTLLNQGASLERIAMELENLRLRRPGASAAGGIAGNQDSPISMLPWKKAVVIKTLSDEG